MSVCLCNKAMRRIITILFARRLMTFLRALKSGRWIHPLNWLGSQNADRRRFSFNECVGKICITYVSTKAEPKNRRRLSSFSLRWPRKKGASKISYLFYFERGLKRIRIVIFARSSRVPNVGSQKKIPRNKSHKSFRRLIAASGHCSPFARLKVATHSRNEPFTSFLFKYTPWLFLLHSFFFRILSSRAL